MRRLGLAVALSALPFAAFAGGVNLVQIVEPAPGVCVNNGGELFTGGIAGGEVQPDPRSVPLLLRLDDPAGRTLELTFFFDGAEVGSILYDFPPGQNSVETDEFSLPAFAVLDGGDRPIRVNARVVDAPGVESADEVTIDLEIL